MIVKPLPRSVTRPLGMAAIVLTSPVWGLLIAILWLDMMASKAVKRLFPPRGDGWRFAWLPVKCDPWPDDGFNGTVWLERVWWTANPRGFCHWSREAPVSA